MFLKMLGTSLLLIVTITLRIAECQRISNEAIRSLKSQLIDSTKKCTQKYNLATVEVFNMIGQNIIPPRDSAKCYFSCMMQEFNLMDDKSNFNEVKLESLMSYFPKSTKYTDAVENKLDVCLNSAKSGTIRRSKYAGCNRAYILVKCMYDGRSTSQIPNKLSDIGKKVTGILPSVPSPELPSFPKIF